jgi:hypothetical protein
VVLSPRKLVREHKSRSSTRIRRDFENPPKTPAYKVKSASIDSSIVFKNSFLDFLHRYQYSHHKTWYVSIRAGVLPGSEEILEIPRKLRPTELHLSCTTYMYHLESLFSISSTAISTPTPKLGT